MDAVRRLLPELSTSLRKGNCGRMGVIGGSMEYTGAPYFAAISMLKVGADLSHVFSPPDAAPVIKSYSPELIVHPNLVPGSWLQRLDSLLVGPGLGREEKSMDVARESILEAQRIDCPLVVDAVGHPLSLIFELSAAAAAASQQSQHKPIILTPNAVEMDRLAQKVLQAATLGRPLDEIKEIASKVAGLLNMHIFVKGPIDMFAAADGSVRLFDTEGTPRRPGGIGDCLSGVLTVFALWAHRSNEPLSTAAEAASFFVRECSRRAYKEIGRGMTATDVIAQVAPLVKHID
ncbi:hypothetical protein PFISCL1PPCAC_8568, partial [Pristionchus fissidentatus]